MQFHHRNMFVRGRVKDHLRAVLRENLLESTPITDIGHNFLSRGITTFRQLDPDLRMGRLREALGLFRPFESYDRDDRIRSGDQILSQR